MRRLWILFFVFLIFPVYAQDAPEITLGETLILSVAAENPTAITFMNDVAGEVVTVTVQAVDSNAVDPVLWVTNPDVQLLAYNNNHLADDGTSQSTARLANLILESSGLHTIYVDSFNGVSEGEVEVSIIASDIFSATVETSDDTEIIRLTLPESMIFSYPITATEGESLTITAYDSNGQLDPYLRIVDSSGNLIISNDDHQQMDTGLNIFAAQILAWDVPADDTYQIELLDFLGRSGDITLEIQHP